MRISIQRTYRQNGLPVSKRAYLAALASLHLRYSLRYRAFAVWEQIRTVNRVVKSASVEISEK